MNSTNNQNSNVVPSSAGEHIRLYTKAPNEYKNVSLDDNFNKESKGNSKKSLQLFFVLFAVFTIVSVTIAVYFTPENSFDVRSNASDTKKIESKPSDNYEFGSSSLPKLINIPPSVVHVGEKYNFTMRISDTDTDIQDIVVVIKKAPAWLIIDGFTLSGYPLVDTEEAEEVVLDISDGENLIEESFFIFVEPSLAVYPDDEIKYELHD